MNKDYKLYVHITPNGKRYYGITKQTTNQRWRNGKGYKNNEYFTRAIDKYGWDNIQHIVLHEELDEDEAKELEQYMIQWYCTNNKRYGYNITSGGEGCSKPVSEETKQKISEALKGRPSPNKGRIVSEETRKKLSEAGKGRIVLEETRKKLSEINKGRIFNEETKRKLSEARKGKYTGKNNPNYGKHHSEETRKKISETLKGRTSPNKGKSPSEETRKKLSEAHKGKNTGENHPRAKSVICITTNNVFYTIKDGANYYNISNSGTISNCCRGKRKTCGKLPDGTPLVWRYIDIIEL